MPKRIQLSRRKGWRMPAGAVSIARPTKWGNRWRVQDYLAAGFHEGPIPAAQHCVEAFRAWLEGRRHWAHGCSEPPPPDPAELRGKDLACWCPLDAPCHGDVLLELANR